MHSVKGVDYTNLQHLLSEGRWKEADLETGKKMCEVMGREKEGSLTVQDINNFPSEDLRIIDQLWVKASNGHFGFSVQKRIYESLGGTKRYLGGNQYYDEKIWKAYVARVGWYLSGLNGWIDYNDHTFPSNDSFDGHLPRGGFTFTSQGGYAVISLGDSGWHQLLLRMDTIDGKQTNKPLEIKVLDSVKGVDYTNLQRLLAEVKWKEADIETRKKMLEVMGRHKVYNGTLRLEDINNFPCEIYAQLINFG